MAKPDRRPFGAGPYLLSVRLRSGGDEHPFDIPAVRAVASMRFDERFLREALRED